MGYGFFGSAVLWLLVTFPAYWFFQWMVEGEPFSLWSRKPSRVASAIGESVEQTLAEAGASLTSAAPRTTPDLVLDTPTMS